MLYGSNNYGCAPSQSANVTALPVSYILPLDNESDEEELREPPESMLAFCFWVNTGFSNVRHRPCVRSPGKLYFWS